MCTFHLAEPAEYHRAVVLTNLTLGKQLADENETTTILNHKREQETEMMAVFELFRMHSRASLLTSFTYVLQKLHNRQ